MKVLYLGNNRPYATERYVRHALNELGHEVFLKVARGTSFLDVESAVAKYQPDFLLFSKPSQPYYPRLLEWCQQRKLLTVCWQWDLFWGYRSQRPPQFCSDLLFTTDGGHQAIWRKLYPCHRVLRQGIHKPDARLWPTRYKWDVGFVGTMHKVHKGRLQLVEALTDHYGDRFRLITDIRGLHLNKALASIRVIVGDSYPADYYWSNRIYEILGRGGFLLYPKTVGLEEEFIDGQHYVGFERGNFRELFKVVDRFVVDEEEREKIRKAGYGHVLSNYTYKHRVAVLLDEVVNHLHPVPPVQARSPVLGG